MLSPTDLAVDPYTSSVTGYGAVNVTGGTLQGTAVIQGNLTVGSGGTVRPGTVNPLVANLAQLGVEAAVPSLPGTLTVTSNGTLSGGANATFDIGPASSLLAVGNTLTLPATGSVTINLIDNGSLVGAVPLITYGGLANTFSGSQLTAGSTPTSAYQAATGFAYTFSTSNNTIYVNAALPLIWSGSSTSTWDTASTPNFTDPNVASNHKFYAGNHVQFDDTGSGSVSIASSGVAPGGVVFQNSAKPYTVTGGPITDGASGHASLTVAGGGLVTLANSANTYTGATTVTAGTLASVNPVGANDRQQRQPDAAGRGDSQHDRQRSERLPVCSADLSERRQHRQRRDRGTDQYDHLQHPRVAPSRSQQPEHRGREQRLDGHTGCSSKRYPPPLDTALGTIVNQIAQACNTDSNENPHWNGTGGITSSAAAQTPATYAVGYLNLGNGQVKVAYTLAGDAFLTGQVNSSDVQVVSGSNLYTTGAGWSGGDFLYEGRTDNADRNIVLNNLNTSLPALTGQAHPLGSGIQPADGGSSPLVEYSENTGALILVDTGAYYLANLDNFEINMANTFGAVQSTLVGARGDHLVEPRVLQLVAVGPTSCRRQRHPAGRCLRPWELAGRPCALGLRLDCLRRLEWRSDFLGCVSCAGALVVGLVCGGRLGPRREHVAQAAEPRRQWRECRLIAEDGR